MSLTSLLFLAAYFSGCIAALVRHPIYGLITYVLMLYLHPPSRWWGEALPDLRWSLLAAAFTLLGVLMKRKSLPTPPIMSHPVMVGLLAFVAWLGLQSVWALDRPMHMELLTIYVKYAVLLALIVKCLDSEEHVRLFLWAHVLGCFYLGWIVYSEYEGGRFEGFGGPDINEANAGALQIVTGIFAGSALFLATNWKGRAVLLGCMPFLVNALVATQSRSGFLAAGLGGVIFNFLAPKRYSKLIRVLSILAVVLFALLTNPQYWLRIGSLQYAGEEVEGVDTGAGRLVIMEAQWRMFLEYPLGCGHRCTASLSTRFLADEYLTGEGAERARASHNTVMSLLVEQGLPGVICYVVLLLWIIKKVLALRRRVRERADFQALFVPAMAAALAAITLGDMFVDYLKMEVRFWYVGLMIVMLGLTAPAGAKAPSRATAPADAGAVPTKSGPS